MFNASGHERPDKMDEELEHFQRLVRVLELEARGKRRRKDHGKHAEGLVSIRSGHGEASHQFGYHRHRDRSPEYADRDLISPEGRQPKNAAMDTMSQALRSAAQSPFSNEIKRASIPSRFTRRSFNSYD